MRDDTPDESRRILAAALREDREGDVHLLRTLVFVGLTIVLCVVILVLSK